MAHLERRRFIVGGKPVIVLAGEVHYFRLRKSEWADRIQKTKDSGCNALASYIPWIFHEEVEGDIDLEGRIRPETNLGEFIDMCHEAGLWFIPRPGPFVMGEVKNEGLPYWIYKNHLDVSPQTWEGKKVTSANVNLLHPGYLESVKRWYQAVMPVLGARLDTKGGPVIAVQLDNEVGMLPCWGGQPDLGEQALTEFYDWINAKWSSKDLAERYPIDLANADSRNAGFRDGSQPWSVNFRTDYQAFTAQRFTKYILKLKGYAEESGVTGVPFLVNLHGTSAGKASTFPIAIAQMAESYTVEPGLWGSSDHYIGELNRYNNVDIYFLNAFMAAVNRPEQPLSSMEFEAGSGDYGELGVQRNTGASADFKARISLVQGNRLLNHYLLAGGHNFHLDHPVEDGNQRVGFTGERHGFAAPVGPEGDLDPIYFDLTETNRTLLAIGDKLADMDEVLDDISLAYVPGYYATDIKRSGPMEEVVRKIEAAREHLDTLVRGMLGIGLSFSGLDIEKPIPGSVRNLALASSECMAADVQQRLLDFAERGGHILMVGRIPDLNLEGQRCTLLKDALGITITPRKPNPPTWYPTIKGRVWAQSEPEISTWNPQNFVARDSEVFLEAVGEGAAGAKIPYGKGFVQVMTATYPLHRPFWDGLFGAMGVQPNLRHDHERSGIMSQPVANDAGEMFFSLANLDSYAKSLKVTWKGSDVIGREVHLAGRTAKMLPYQVKVGPLEIERATCEVARSGASFVAFRRTPVEEVVYVKGTPKLEVDGGRVARTDQGLVLTISPGLGLSEVRVVG